MMVIKKKTIFLKNNTVAVKVAGGIWGSAKIFKRKNNIIGF